MKNEPALTVAGIAAAVGAVITLLVAFGLELSEKQVAAILGLVTIVGPLVAGYFTRGKVTPSGQ